MAYIVSSHGIRETYAYEWLSILFYSSFLLALGGSYGDLMVDKALRAIGTKGEPGSKDQDELL